MTIEFQCASCRELVSTPDATAGKKGRCPHCGEIVNIPIRSQTAADKSPSAEDALPSRAPIEFNCAECLELVSTSAHMAGKKGRCPHCNAVVKIPHKSTLISQQPEPDLTPADSADDEDEDDLLTIEFCCPQCQELVQTPLATAGKRGRCPHCEAVIQIPGQGGRKEQPKSAAPARPTAASNDTTPQPHKSTAPAKTESKREGAREDRPKRAIPKGAKPQRLELEIPKAKPSEPTEKAAKKDAVKEKPQEAARPTADSKLAAPVNEKPKGKPAPKNESRSIASDRDLLPPTAPAEKKPQPSREDDDLLWKTPTSEKPKPKMPEPRAAEPSAVKPQKISFYCSNCGTLVTTPGSAAGKKGKCPQCKSVVIIPAQSAKVRPKPKAVDKSVPLPPIPLDDDEELADLTIVEQPETSSPAAQPHEGLIPIDSDSTGLTPIGPAAGGYSGLTPMNAPGAAPSAYSPADPYAGLVGGGGAYGSPPYGSVPAAQPSMSMNPYAAPLSYAQPRPQHYKPKPQGPAGRIEFGRCFKSTFAIYKTNLGFCLVVPMLVMLVWFCFSIVLMIVGCGLGLVSAALGIGMLESGNLEQMSMVASLINLVAALIQGLIILAFQAWLNGGLTLLFVRLTQRNQGELGDLFAGGPYFARVAGVLLPGFLLSLGFQIVTVLMQTFAPELGGLLLSIGSLALAAIQLILWVLLLFSVQLIVDRDQGAVEAMINSAKLVAQNILMVLVMLILCLFVWGIIFGILGAAIFASVTIGFWTGNILVGILLALLAFVVFFVVMLLIWPLYSVLHAVMYCQATGQATGDEQSFGYSGY